MRFVLKGDSTTKDSERGVSRAGFSIVLGLILLTVAYRLASSHLEFAGNTAPLIATAFGGALLLGLRFWWIPALALVASDVILGIWHGGGGLGGYTILTACFIFAVSYLAAVAGKRGKTWARMWFGTLVCSVAFYAVANTYSWLAWPGYEKSVQGWWQSQTTGVPNVSPPAWTFLRNALLADTIWCGLAGLLFFFDFGSLTRAEASASKSV